MSQGGSVEQLCKCLGLEGVDLDLIARALRHPSYVRELGQPAAESNQRLEFLGDAVLDLVLADHLFGDASRLSEGDLTKLKSSLVREETLARVGRRIGLGEFLRLGRGEEETGGREKTSLIADCLEALIAAVYLSAGLQATGAFVLRHFGSELESAISGGPADDPKTALQELLQERTKRPPEYHTVPAGGPAHDPSFASECRFGSVVLGRGSGKSKREAEKEAARAALADPDAIWRVFNGAPDAPGDE